MTEAPPTPKRRCALTGLVALVAFGAVTLFLFRSAGPPPVVVFSADAPLKPRPPVLSKWMPANWRWLWGLRYAVFGYPTTYALQSTALEVGTNAHKSLAPFALPAPACQTNGVEFWYLPTNKIAEIKKHFEQHAHIRGSPAIMTSQGALARMFSGHMMPIRGMQTDIGWQFECVPRPHPAATDLAMRLIDTTFALANDGTNLCVVTNTAFAARLQIPNKHGVLLVQQNDTNATAMLIVGEWKDPNRKK
ncbi:MAG TPA: hypothetical protein VJ063_12930 [Verrucomicrobiae bacterium]|nr:hypothetical protein [Verrucomicrobiae bacterium]